MLGDVFFFPTIFLVGMKNSTRKNSAQPIHQAVRLIEYRFFHNCPSQGPRKTHCMWTFSNLLGGVEMAGEGQTSHFWPW